MRCGGERKRRGDDLSMEIHGGQDIFQSEMPVGEEGNIRSVQVAPEFLFQAEMLGTHIGEKPAVPQVADFFTVFFKFRHGGPGDVDSFLIHLRYDLQSIRLSTISRSKTGIPSASRTRLRSEKESSIKIESGAI